MTYSIIETSELAKVRDALEFAIMRDGRKIYAEAGSIIDAARPVEVFARVTDNFKTDFSEISRTYEKPIKIGTELYAIKEQS
jgi:hypothetical protein